MTSWRGAPIALLLLTSGTAETPSGREAVRLAMGKVPASEVATWKKLSPAHYPGPRWFNAMAYFPPTAKTYVFGGYDYDQEKYLDDLWAWDGKDWSQVAADARPPARDQAALAFDPARQSLLLYGGAWSSPQTYLTDTWEWTPDKGWRELAPADNPGTGYTHALITDTSRDKVLFFHRTKSVWEWDGSAQTWSNRTPVAAPDIKFSSQINGPAATYDDVRHKLVVHEALGSFWEWDPFSAGWSLRDSHDSFEEVTLNAMAYDSSRKRHVLLLDNNHTAISQTLEVDTQVPTWYMRSIASAPGQGTRVRTMVFDSARNCMVLWGQEIKVTWEYTVRNLGNGEGCTSAADCDSGNCVEGVCCDVAACAATCTSCNVAGSQGTCAVVPAGTEVPGSCATGLACDSGGKCKTKNGQACTANGDCASGFCADGVCCDGACDGACMACNQAGQAGSCRPYPSGSDPENECGKGTAPCKSACDGAGSCVFPKEAVACGTCTTCDGLGSCRLFDQACWPGYPLPGATCYVDSTAGDDTRSGLSEAEAVRSQSRIDPSCTTVRYRRGSVFPEKLRIVDKVLTYANYGDEKKPLPKFVVPRTRSSGPVAQAMGTAQVKFDGLAFAGATGDGSVEGQVQGACVVLGFLDRLENSELSDCDIGVLLADANNTVQGNYIHDLVRGVDAAPGVDPYLAGGAFGVLVRSSGNLIAWNTFVHCMGPAVPGGGACYGAAVAFVVAKGGSLDMSTVENNYSYGNCGFAAIGTAFGDAGSWGSYSNLSFHYNISVDSGVMALLEVGSTRLRSISFTNNTIVQHKGSINAGTLATTYAAGANGGDLQPDSVKLQCNLLVVDEVQGLDTLLAKSFTQDHNLVLDMQKQDPGFVDRQGTTAAAYDLVATSPAVNACRTYEIAGESPPYADFFGRQAPDSKSMKIDVGACELGSPQSKPPKFSPGAAGWIGTDGTRGAGGVGGTGGTGGTAPPATGTGGTAGKGGTGGTGTGAGGAGTSSTGKGGTGGGGVSSDAGAMDVPRTGGISGSGGGASTGGIAASGTGTGGAGSTSRSVDAGPTGPAKHASQGCSCNLGKAKGGGLWTVLAFIVPVFGRRRRQPAR